MNVVKELIQSGVDVDEQDQFGSTALTVSAAYNDKRIIKLLLKKACIFEELMWTSETKGVGLL